MPLIACPECSEEISDTAAKCPKCGVTLREAKRGIFGKIVKWSFILFNIFMAWAMFEGMSGVSEVVSDASSDAEKAGAGLGAGLGFMFLLGIWVFGDIILGLMVLFTKPKQI